MIKIGKIIITFILIISTFNIVCAEEKVDEKLNLRLGRYKECDIVFTSDFHDPGCPEQQYELYCIKEDGSGLRRITNNDYFEFHADVSPTRQEILTITLFEEGKDKGGEMDKNAEIVIWDFNGNIVKRVTNNQRTEAVPHWSADGEKIMFFVPEKGNFNIYIIDRDGCNEKKLTSGKLDFDPAPSPNNEIIFARGKSLMLMNEDGSNLREIIELEHEPADPIFIDSNTIVFEIQPSKSGNYGYGDFDIFSVNKDGTGLKELSNNDYVDVMPQPTGNKITFWRIAEGQEGTQLMIMDKDGSNQKELLTEIANSQMPTGNN